MNCRKCRAEQRGLIAGQAFTKYKCSKCGQLGYHHNTAVPKICDYCSNTFFICQTCRADLLLDEILDQKEKTNLYDVALMIGCSEYSLRMYIKKGTVGNQVHKKIVRWFRERNGR